MLLETGNTSRSLNSDKITYAEADSANIIWVLDNETNCKYNYANSK